CARTSYNPSCKASPSGDNRTQITQHRQVLQEVDHLLQSSRPSCSLSSDVGVRRARRRRTSTQAVDDSPSSQCSSPCHPSHSAKKWVHHNMPDDRKVVEHEGGRSEVDGPWRCLMATTKQNQAARRNMEKARKVQSARARGAKVPRKTRGLSTAEQNDLPDSAF